MQVIYLEMTCMHDIQITSAPSAMCTMMDIRVSLLIAARLISAVSYAAPKFHLKLQKLWELEQY